MTDPSGRVPPHWWRKLDLDVVDVTLLTFMACCLVLAFLSGCELRVQFSSTPTISEGKP